MTGNTPRPIPSAVWPLLTLLLAACSPDFRDSMGGPPQTAALSAPRPPVVARNPFWCRRAYP